MRRFKQLSPIAFLLLHSCYCIFAAILDELKKQKESLENALGHEIVSIRQHYLHYDIRVTPVVHATAGFKYDSTLGFNDNVGFRFGTCYPYHLYDLKAKKQLPIKEIPLIIQDGAMLSPVKGMRLDKETAFQYVKQIAETVEKVGGVLTLLWHPNHIIKDDWWNLYLRTLEYLKEKNAWFGSVRKVGMSMKEKKLQEKKSSTIKKVLFVSYLCPPNFCIGALRVAKMLKYLPQFGYQIYILGGGLETDNNPYIFKPKYFDPFQFGKMCRDITKRTLRHDFHCNKNVVVEEKIWKHSKPKGLWPLSEVRMPDKYMFWIWPAIRLGKQLLKREKFDIIYSSSGPASSAIVASNLQSYSQLPWVAEFRDLWSNNHIDLRIPVVHKFDSYLEDKILKSCNALITVSEPLKECLEKKHHKPTYVVCNGYDEDDYPKRRNLTKKLTITYTGKIYIGKRDPTPLFEAIANLSKDKKITPLVFQVRFYGPDQVIINALAEKYGIKDYIYMGGTISYEESLSRQCESWILLLLEWNDPSAKGVLTGKLFEYLGSKRPILCIGYNEGSISKILQETEAGKILNDPRDIERFLIWCINEYKKGNNSLGFMMNDSALNYSRRMAAENLSKVFSSLI